MRAMKQDDPVISVTVMKEEQHIPKPKVYINNIPFGGFKRYELIVFMSTKKSYT